MKSNLKKLAVAFLSVAGLSGCTSMQVADPAGTNAAAGQAEESRVLRPLPGYDYKGGYRMRRFASMPASS